MIKKKDIGEHLFDIVVELMTANTIAAMKLLHAQDGTKYSPKELEWLARIIDADNLCSDDYPDDEGDDDPLHEVKN